MSLLLRLAGVTIAIGLGSFTVLALVAPLAGGEAPAADPAPEQPAAFAPLPPVNDQAMPAILAMSPFAQDRSAFDRATASAPPAPPVEVKLTGIFRVGRELRASLIVGGQSIVVREGDDTAAGKVGKITGDSVVLAGPSDRVFEMFR
ncbi:MAG: hypothetical protein RIR33_3122 [Pseudomonadota bacterium]|jgi:hypothetical protein